MSTSAMVGALQWLNEALVERKLWTAAFESHADCDCTFESMPDMSVR